MSIQSVLDYPDISFIDDITLTELKARMRNKYIEVYKEYKDGAEPDLSYTTKESLMLDAAAGIIYQMMLSIDNQGKMGLLKYATGEYLDNLGALKGVSRKEKSAATVTLRFSMEAARAATTGIPKGTNVTPGDGTFFATREYAEIKAGSTSVDVVAECTTPGTSGNNYAKGEINKFVDAVPFISSVTNITISEGGAEEETDDEYRESIFEAPNGYSTGGSKEAYKWLCHEFSNLITDVYVASPSPNEVEIRYILENGELPGEELNTRLKEYINASDRKIICDVISVAAPETTKYNVELTYYIARSSMTRAEAIQNAVTEAVDEYISWQQEAIGRDINPDMLIKKVIAAGAIRCDIKSPVRTVLNDKTLAIINSKKITYGGIEDD